MTMSGVDFTMCCAPALKADDEAVAVAFANTACAESGSDVLVSTRTALAFFISLGMIDERAAARVSKRLKAPSAQRTLARLSNFRSMTVCVLETLRTGSVVPAKHLDWLNAELSACGCRREVRKRENSYDIRIVYEYNELIDVLMPVANSLAEILGGTDPTRIKRCREERCSCYFVDASKNRTRAWCSMQRCGNRQKVANYYQRQRAL